LVIRHQGLEGAVGVGAEHLTIHDAADGQLLWSCGGFNPEANKLWPAIATPVIVDGVAVVAYGRNDRGIPRLHGVRLDGTGDVTASNHLWKRDDVGTFVPSPLVHRGGILLVGDQGEVERVDPRTGKTVWKHQFTKNRAKFYASPLVAGDRLYAATRGRRGVRGPGSAWKAAKRYPENNMGDWVIASPVPYGDGLLIRTEKHLVRANATP
jgi:outer membrane protein assembly factor BamB